MYFDTFTCSVLLDLSCAAREDREMVNISINGTVEVFLNPFAKGLAKHLPITVCDGIINLQINKSTTDFCQIFLLDKDVNVILYTLSKKSNVYILYSFIDIFIYNSIIKYYWENFAKPLAKAFRKTSIICKKILQKLFQTFVKFSCNQLWIR